MGPPVETIERDLRRLLWVQAIRASLYGFATVVLATSLAASDLSDTQVGLVFTAMLVGMALATIGVGIFAERVGPRRLYAALLVAFGVVGTVFALTDSFVILIAVSLTGMMSTDANESGPITSLEQAMIGQAPSEVRIRVFGRYNAIAYLAGAVGALAAGGPAFFRDAWHGAPDDQRWLLLFPLGALVCLILALGLSRSVEATGATRVKRPLERSRSNVLKLSSLFALDAFAGGFVVMTFIVFWFERTFGASAQLMSIVVFAGGLLQAGSSIVAARIGGRFGLLNTMVFSHLPSNVLLALVPFMPTLGAGDRGAARSVRAVADGRAHAPGLHRRDGRSARSGRRRRRSPTRRGTWQGRSGPVIGTALMQNVAVGAPFVVAGGVKCVYDLLLWRTFKKVPLPGDGERATPPRPSG